MKALKYLLGSALAVMAMACTTKEIYYVYPEYDEDTYVSNAAVTSESPYFTATDEGGEIDFKTKGGDVTISVDFPDNWSAEVSDETKAANDWLTVTADSKAGLLTISASRNTATETHTAIIKLVSDYTKATIATFTVTQNAYGTPEISADINVWNAPAVGTLTLEVAVESSFDEWKVETASTWLLVEKTGDGLLLTVDENEENDARSTEVVLTSTDGTDSDSETIVVNQDGKAYIEVSAGSFTFYEDMEAKVSSTTVESNFDWDFSYDTSNGWFTITRDGDTLTAAVSSENTEDDNREADVTITAGDGLENIAEYTLHVTQLGVQGGSLVLIYTTTEANTQIQLPLDGTVDCTVDWGDGDSEAVTSTFPTHTYTTAGEYIVSIKGTVTALNSNSVNKDLRVYLTGIKQWGETGLTSLANAFYGCTGLYSIPGDTSGAFSEVTTATYAFYNCGTATYFEGTTTYDPSTAAGLYEVSEDLFQYATKCTDFSYTFYGCQNLHEIPAGLFRNCSAATTFYFCFDYAVNIQEVPEGLFDACTELTNAGCIFSYCASVTKIPATLFAKTTKVTDIRSCFTHCESLEEIPEGLFDNMTECDYFYNVFSYCTALKKIPENLFANNTKSTTFKTMFLACSNIEEIPQGLFDNMTSCTDMFGVFQKCTKLKSVPADILKDASAVTTIERLFYECPNLTEVPAGIFDNLPKCTTFANVFYGTGITTLPSDLFANVSSSVTSISAMFENCENLESVPDGALDYFTNVTNMSSLFYGCTNLKSIPEDLFKNNSKVTNLASVFRECTSLTEIPAGLFTYTPAVTSVSYAFAGCTGITKIPENLFNGCSKLATMSYVFQDCTGLTEIEEEAFANMTAATTWASAFSGCTNLKKIGAKAFYGNSAVTTFASVFSDCPIETVGESAFEGCSKLATANALFSGSTTLKSVGKRAFAATCTTASGTPTFANLFQNCTALTELGDEIFADSAVKTISYLFDGCSGLTSLPESMFDGCTAIATGTYVFRNCTGLTSLPAGLLSSWTALKAPSYLFYGCTGLTSLPDGILDGLSGATSMTQVFYGCTGLASIPSTLFAKNTACTSISSTFVGCTSLTEIPEGLFDTLTACKTFSATFQDCSSIEKIPDGLFDKTIATSFATCFSGCSSLKSIPDGLFTTSTGVTTFNATFKDCTSLTSIPTSLFDTNTAAVNFGNTFSGCTSLGGESPYTEITVDGATVKVHLYDRQDYTTELDCKKPTTTSGCFTGCTGLTDYDSIYNTWL